WKMPSLLDCCEKFFGTRDLYAVLNVSKDASDKQGIRHCLRADLMVLKPLGHPMQGCHKSGKSEKCQEIGAKVSGKMGPGLSFCLSAANRTPYNPFVLLFYWENVREIDNSYPVATLHGNLTFLLLNGFELLKLLMCLCSIAVRKAYHKLSLVVHPDRVDDNNKLEATEKFKVLGHVHSILSDSEKRKIYDETGDCGEDGDEPSDRDWSAYWRSCFKEITVEDINNYEKKYKGSDEELEDLKKAYLHGKGSMDWILEAVPFTNTDEEDRLRERLKPLMDNGEIPVYKRFTHENPKKTAARKRKYEKEAKEAEELAAEYGLDSKKKAEDDGDGSLMAIIKARQGQRLIEGENFLDRLAERVSKASKGSKKKTGSKSKK
ncbi:DnaJ-like protein subfamily C member 9, partial [Frankliniella fusca]